jgi:hypothetical protein
MIQKKILENLKSIMSIYVQSKQNIINVIKLVIILYNMEVDAQINAIIKQITIHSKDAYVIMLIIINVKKNVNIIIIITFQDVI